VPLAARGDSCPDGVAHGMTDPSPAIELVAVTKRYGDAVALDAVSLQITKGEFFCLLGPSGCGKTTTLNLIGGFIPLSEGELRIDGRRVNDLPPHKRSVNTVFQNYALFPHMTVAQNVAFGLRMEHLPQQEIDARVTQYLELVGLAGYLRRFPSEMSGGQQQRVALARALAKRPSVLLLDEPLGALDLKLRKQMQAELTRIHRQVGTTFVFVTHDQEEALSMATRIAIMSDGHVIQVGTPREIYERPVDRFVANFVGETNFLTGEVAQDGPGAVLRLVGGDEIAVPAATAPGAATLMIRPESLGLRPVGTESADPGIVGRIANIAFMGNHTRITVATGSGDLVVMRPQGMGARSAGPIGEVAQEVCVWWSASDAALIGDSENTRGGGLGGPA
jgi:spermidine/putrescine transport system ATP-binding protein